VFPREQPGTSRSDKRLLSLYSKAHAVLEISFGFILTVIPFLVLIPGAWALAVWASRERDAQSKLVEKLTTREKDLARTGEATSEPGPPTKEKAPQRLRG